MLRTVNYKSMISYKIPLQNKAKVEVFPDGLIMTNTSHFVMFCSSFACDVHKIRYISGEQRSEILNTFIPRLMTKNTPVLEIRHWTIIS